MFDSESAEEALHKLPLFCTSTPLRFHLFRMLQVLHSAYIIWGMNSNCSSTNIKVTCLFPSLEDAFLTNQK